MLVICDLELWRVYDGVVGSKEGESDGKQKCESYGYTQTSIYGILLKLVSLACDGPCLQMEKQTSAAYGFFRRSKSFSAPDSSSLLSKEFIDLRMSILNKASDCDRPEARKETCFVPLLECTSMVECFSCAGRCAGSLVRLLEGVVD
jgi:hypothetical protein